MATFGLTGAMTIAAAVGLGDRPRRFKSRRAAAQLSADSRCRW